MMINVLLNDFLFVISVFGCESGETLGLCVSRILQLHQQTLLKPNPLILWEKENSRRERHDTAINSVINLKVSCVGWFHCWSQKKKKSCLISKVHKITAGLKKPVDRKP